jgi:alpha-N-arabinofuranosidase
MQLLRPLAALAALAILPVARPADPVAQLTVDGTKSGAVINPNLYGQFTEHLGHCI